MFNVDNDSLEARDVTPFLLPSQAILPSRDLCTDAILSAAPMSPRLPQELCDAIIDELNGIETYHPWGDIDWHTESRPLKRCALVCRGWRPRAQFWLFRNIALGSFRALRKLESQLDLREDLLLIIREIRIGCTNVEGYPVGNLPSAVAPLARRCPNLTVLSLRRTGNYELNEDTSPSHPHIPFHLRLHSALIRQSFRSVMDLHLSWIHYHSDADFLAFLSSFTALESLFLSSITCNIVLRLREREYVLLLRKRTGIFGKLRYLRMVRDLSL